MQFTIVNPQDSQLIEQISDALHQEWANLAPWENLATIRSRLIERCSNKNQQILSCYIDENGKLLAKASTTLYELPDIHQATWWLGEELTVPSARGQKIGSQLIEQLYIYYKKHINQKLYLYTPDMQELYRHME